MLPRPLVIEVDRRRSSYVRLLHLGVTILKQTGKENLEIGVSTKLIVTARIRGNVLLKMSFLHILKI